jgi:hypothetical protein
MLDGQKLGRTVGLFATETAYPTSVDLQGTRFPVHHQRSLVTALGAISYSIPGCHLDLQVLLCNVANIIPNNLVQIALILDLSTSDW